MPNVTVTGNDRIALSLELLSCLPECIIVTGTSANFLLNSSSLIRSENFLSDGSSVDHSTTGSLISESYESLIGRSCTDVNCVLSDLCILEVLIDINSEILISSCELSCIALSILKNESCLCCVQINFTILECCVECRLVSTVRCSDDCYIDCVLLAEIRVKRDVLLSHVRNFVCE